MSAVLDCTARLAEALRIAGEEAVGFGHRYIETEHVLLGMLRGGENAARRVLDRLNVPRDRLLQNLLEVVTPGRPGSGDGTDMPHSIRTREVLEFAHGEARAMERPEFGTEHVLIGLLRQKTGLAGQTMLRTGITLEALRDAAVHVAGDAETPPSASGATIAPTIESVTVIVEDSAGRLVAHRFRHPQDAIAYLGVVRR